MSTITTISTKPADVSASGVPTKVTKPAATSASEAKGKGPKMQEVPKVVLPPPTNPAMDYLVQGTAETMARVEHLQQSAAYIFKAVASVPQLKASISELKNNQAAEAQRITTLETKVDSILTNQVEMLKNQSAILETLKTIAERPASFTADDRTSLSTILTNQSDQTSKLSQVATDVHTVMMHVLPDDHAEGKRVATELADTFLDVLNTGLSNPTSPYIKKPSTSHTEPIAVSDEKEVEEEEEDEEDDEEDDDVTHHYGGDEDDDDDFDGKTAMHFSLSQPPHGSTPSQGSDPSGSTRCYPYNI